MKRRMDEDEFRLIVKELTELGYVKLAQAMTMDNSFINGVTVFETNDSPQGKLIRYVEDDVSDEAGNPYIFEYPYYNIFGEFNPGKRLISVYVGRSHVIIPVTGDTFTLVGAFDSEKAKVDKGKSVKIPTPLALDLPKEEARRVTESDLVDVKYAIKHYGKFKAGQIVGAIALSILCFIIVGLIYIFTVVAIDDSGNLTGGLLLGLSVVALILLVAGITCSIKFFKNIYLRNALKMKYIKKIMVVGVSNHLPISASQQSVIKFYEWVDGKIEFSACEIGMANSFLSDKVEFGDVINMLTVEPNQDKKMIDTRIFCDLKEK